MALNSYISDHSTPPAMALMKAAQVWEKFLLKDLTTFARYAKVELTPPGPGEIGGIFRGAGNLVKDAATFKWAQVEMIDILSSLTFDHLRPP